jgi:3'-phosphoadenosine 5'-phosphosulfate (PAPS) 3'-phosphatase
MPFGKEIEIARKPPNAPQRWPWRHQAAGVRADTKPDASPVTQADRECEKLIAGFSNSTFPRMECWAKKARARVA